MDREAERQKYIALLDTKYGSTNHGKHAYEIVQSFNPKLVVDLDCGRNDFIKHLRTLGIRGIGIDFVFPGDVIGYMHCLPLASNSVDVITCFDALEHLLPEEVDDVLNEMRRVGRHFVFSICTRESKICPNLHPTVRPMSWWMEKISNISDCRKDKYIVGTFKNGN